MNINKNISIWRGDSTPPTNYHFWIKSNGLLFTFNGEKWVNYVEDIPIVSLESKGLMSSLDKVNLEECVLHLEDTSNPHSVTKAQVGLSNVTNDAQVKRSEMGVANGVATLDADGKVPASQLPSYVDDITYDELKSLRDSSKLIPGMLYRITDYEFTTLNPLLKAKPSTFDIIVTADDDHTLNEDARAVEKDIFQVTKLNEIDIEGKYAGMVDDADYYEYEDVMEIDGVVYYKWRKYDGEGITDFFILTDTRIFEGVTDKSPYTPIGYGWTDADGLYSEGGSHSDKAVFPADANESRNYAAWELKYTIDNVLWSAIKGQWISTDDDMEFERVGTIEIDGETWVLWYNKDFDPEFGEGETKGYCASYGEVESDDTALALVDIENKRIVSEDYNFVYSYYKGDAEGKGTILWLKDEYRNSAYYDHHNVLVRQGSKWFPTFAAGCYDNIIGPYNNEYGSRFERIGVNIFYKGCCNNRLGANNLWNRFGNNCYDNTFGDSCSSNTFSDSCGCNTFGSNCTSNRFGDSCSSNTFEYNCYDNTFTDSCRFNKFGGSCTHNTFGSNCTSNRFGDSCSSNTFEYNCYSNKFGNNCYANTFLNSCTSNTFLNSCTSNTFTDSCRFNKFGGSCTSNTLDHASSNNTFGYGCSNNRLGLSCNSNTFGDNCKSNNFGNNCDANTFGDNCNFNNFGWNCNFNTFGTYCCRLSIKDQVFFAYVLQSTNYSSDTTSITIDFLPSQTTYCQYAGYNSSGELKIWVPADLVLV